MTRTLLLTLALMCENVNAAPQAGQTTVWAAPSQEGHAAGPAVAAPFTLSNPMCQTGFTIAMRFDERNTAGAIVKSVWVRKCTNGRIVYGRKV